MIAQAGPLPKYAFAHEHAWTDVADAEEFFGYSATICKVCSAWRLDTPLGVLSCSPLLAFYQLGIGRAAVPRSLN